MIREGDVDYSGRPGLVLFIFLVTGKSLTMSKEIQLLPWLKRRKDDSLLSKGPVFS